MDRIEVIVCGPTEDKTDTQILCSFKTKFDLDDTSTETVERAKNEAGWKFDFSKNTGIYLSYKCQSNEMLIDIFNEMTPKIDLNKWCIIVHGDYHL